ncbi:MAG: NAD(+)/NADH kinase [Pseudomonadota bacterium]
MRIGLIVNPIAGMGGSVGLAGTDGAQRLERAIAMGAQPTAEHRCAEFLMALSEADSYPRLTFVTAAPDPASDVCMQNDVPAEQVALDPQLAASQRTEQAITALLNSSVSLIVFVGGDGTAGDVLRALYAAGAQNCPVLGIPAGVKMHSGVFAVTPRAGARVIQALADGGLVSVSEREVRDFVPHAQHPDQMQVDTLGTLLVPDLAAYLQHTKVGGFESEPLAVEEIAAHVLETIDQVPCVILGPGSTCLAIKQKLGMKATLRGFDIFFEDASPCLNATSEQISQVVARYASAHLVLSFTRGQGFLLGRGNQQLSPQVLRSLQWQTQVTIVGSRTKLNSLDGRPLLIDTSDAELDRALSGLVHIVAGYEDILLHQVASDYADKS